MQLPSKHEISELLVACSAGDESAQERLMPFVYDELHRLAHRYMSGERTGHTLQTTALVNEAYLRLVDWRVGRTARISSVSIHDRDEDPLGRLPARIWMRGPRITPTSTMMPITSRALMRC